MPSTIETQARAVVDVVRKMPRWPGYPTYPTLNVALQSLCTAIDDADADPELMKRIREAADARWNCDGEIEIDDDAVVSVSDDPGAYVQAWVWVDASAYGGDEEEKS
ncbi:MAG: hypothetical protein GY906_24220 [bacterium]|nr:hypothetical protein [bacterium]